MRTVSVELGDRSYNIYVGAGLLSQASVFDRSVIGQQVVIATNPAVSTLYLDALRSSLGDRDIHVYEFAEGESEKTLDAVSGLIDFMIAVPCDRQVTVVALGGGIVGDMAGFTSACYQRGTNYVQVPTTLLAQVDSAVGGKTAVNHRHGKNMIGAFHQPEMVVADTDTLKSLDDRQYRAGLAEVLKYGVIHDAEFFAWLEQNRESVIAREADAVSHIIATSCQIKADIVRRDEREQGVRALLNLGHTFGHAIETHTKYSSWLHGEAVAAGMIMAAQMARRCGNINEQTLQRIESLIVDYGLPRDPPADLAEAEFRQHMQRDKKVQNGMVRLVLPTAIGDAAVFSDYSQSALSETLRHCQHRAAEHPVSIAH